MLLANEHFPIAQNDVAEAKIIQVSKHSSGKTEGFRELSWADQLRVMPRCPGLGADSQERNSLNEGNDFHIQKPPKGDLILRRRERKEIRAKKPHDGPEV